MPATDEVQEVFSDEDVQCVANGSPIHSDDDAATEVKSARIALAKPSVSFKNVPSRELHEDFFRKSIEVIINEAVFKSTSTSGKVLEWHHPHELLNIFDFELKTHGRTHEDLLQLIRDTIQYSVKTAHPYFVNQLFSSLDPYGLIGQWLTDALNPSVCTYEVSPVFTLMEETVLREMREIVGYPNGKGDGIFCPGGSMANAYAISCARYAVNPDIKKSGLNGGARMVLFTSEDAHYSIKKMASFLGIGTDNVYLIKTDKVGKMDTSHLVEEIGRAVREGAKPFMVSATAGTTVYGAFDPLEKIADVCQGYGLWFHVDAAWGGGILMSSKHRHILNGIHRADSVTWNPHKLLTAPQQCSTFLLRHEGILSEVHSTNASYLFQKDKFYDTRYDTGDKHVQCGRRADVLKFWFMWKAKGSDGFEKHVDKVFDNARYFTKVIKERPGFRMVVDNPEFTNLCFWYIPPSLRGADSEPNFDGRLHEVAPKMKERMMKKGSMMVTYQTIKGLPNFFRIVFQNSGLEYSDMVHLVEELESLGCDL